VFNPTPSSSQYFANGNNSGDPANAAIYTPFTGPGGQASCASTLPAQTPAIVNEGSTGGNQFTGIWSSPAALNNMVSVLANGADTTYSCGIGAPCNGS